MSIARCIGTESVKPPSKYNFPLISTGLVNIGILQDALPIFLINFLSLELTYSGFPDSVPIQRAIDKGYDKIVVVCTRKKGSFSSVKKYELPIYKNLYSKYPKFVKAAEKRGALYKKQIALCEELEKQGNVILIRPTMPEISRLESNLNEISLSYYHGYTKAKEYVDQIKKW